MKITTRDYSQFFNAVKQNKLDIVEELLDIGIGINDLNDALIMAILEGHVQMTSLLLDKGADVNCGNGDPLYLAVRNKNLRLVKLLLSRGADVWDNGSYYGAFEIVMSYLEKDAGKTHHCLKPGLAFYQSILERSPEIFKELILAAKRYRDQNAHDYPLSVFEDTFDCLLLYSLLKDFYEGVDIILGYQLTSGASVLRTTLRKDLQGGAEELISKGVRCGNEIEEAMFRRNWRLVKFLVKKGFECDPNRCLPMSVECGDILEFLINKGVNSDALQVALGRAVRGELKESAELLLKHGARPTPDLVPYLAKMNLGIFSL